jgi:hypothetical protein
LTSPFGVITQMWLALFLGLLQIVPKKGCARTQHGVPTDQLANMDGPNVRCHQPRLHYVGAEDKFIIETQRHIEEQFTILGDQIKSLIIQLSNMLGHNGDGSRDPSTKCRTHGRQHRVQAHANQ